MDWLSQSTTLSSSYEGDPGHCTLDHTLQQTNDVPNVLASNHSNVVQGLTLDVRFSVVSSKLSDRRFHCSMQNCRTSCRRKSDLRRHEATVHRTHKVYWCPVLECDRSSHHVVGRPFPRKDKRDEHFRKIHSKGIPGNHLSPVPKSVLESIPELIQDFSTEPMCPLEFDALVDVGSLEPFDLSVGDASLPFLFDSTYPTFTEPFVQGETQMTQDIAPGYEVSLFSPLTHFSGTKHIGNLPTVPEEFQLTCHDDPLSTLDVDAVGTQYGLGTDAPLDNLDALSLAFGKQM